MATVSEINAKLDALNASIVAIQPAPVVATQPDLDGIAAKVDQSQTAVDALAARVATA